MLIEHATPNNQVSFNKFIRSRENGALQATQQAKIIIAAIPQF